MTMLTEHSSREPLAIVGIGCRLPGGADSAESLWNLLCSETDATCVVPETRWNAARYHDPNPAKVGKIVTRRGGFLSEIDQFDPQFFGMSPREAHSLDPQQRLLLHATWEALEDGGIPADGLAGTDVGVFIGGFTLDYQLLQNQGRTSRYRFKSHSATGMMMTMLANRISHAFDFRGPSMTIDTACSGSLVAVHLAAQSIWNGECDLALAGGVNIMIGPNTAIAESKSGFLSPEGRSKAFDDSADGYARGEGGAIVVIKPLQRALDDGDEIYAQILGTAVSQDGHTDGITVPREEAQEAAIRTALRRAGVEPTEVGYVEAHGTGTPVGDPIELRALASALTLDRPATNPLLIGSIKTNIGHLEAGAGVAGLIKAALVAKHGYIPANLHLQNPTRHVSLAELKIDVPGTGRPFPDYERRVVGVNSFGFGGTNAHVVLAEPPAPACASAVAIAPPRNLLADGTADLGPQRGSTGRDGRSVGRASGRTPRCHAVGSGLHARPATHPPEPSARRDRRQHRRCARTTSSPRRRRADRHEPPGVHHTQDSHSCAPGWVPSGGRCAGGSWTSSPLSPTASCAAIESCPVTRTGLSSTSSDAMRPVRAWPRPRSRNRPTSPFRSRWPSSSRISG